MLHSCVENIYGKFWRIFFKLHKYLLCLKCKPIRCCRSLQPHVSHTSECKKKRKKILDLCNVKVSVSWKLVSTIPQKCIDGFLSNLAQTYILTREGIGYILEAKVTVPLFIVRSHYFGIDKACSHPSQTELLCFDAQPTSYINQYPLLSAIAIKKKTAHLTRFVNCLTFCLISFV